MRVRRSAVGALLTLAGPLVLLVPEAGSTGVDGPRFSLVSVDRSGHASSSGHSSGGVLSGDGRFVTFVSAASDLTRSGVSRGGEDVFLRDLRGGTTRNLVPRSNGLSHPIDISGDGSRVLFASTASALTRPHTDGQRHLFVWRKGHGITQVDLRPSGRQPRIGETGASSLSANGRWVVFVSDSPGLVGRSVTEGKHVYRRDLRTGRTTVLDPRADGNSSRASVDGTGSTVAFISRATNLADGQSAHYATLLVWRPGTGLQNLTPGPDGSTYAVDVSRDGTTLAVETADSLDPTDHHVASDVYRVALDTGEATWLTQTTGNAESIQPAISDHGRWIVFTSFAALTPDDTDGDGEASPRADIYRIRTGWDGPELVSTSPTAVQTVDCVSPSVSGDGRRITFFALDAGLAPSDHNGNFDVILANYSG